MDQAATHKLRKSQLACQAAGWHFQPFVADCFGALRADARAFISRFIHRYHQCFYPLSEAEVGRAVWGAVSAAVIARPAMELGRLTLADSPVGMPLGALNLRTSRLKTSTLPQSPTPDMGNYMGLSPSQPSRALECLDDEMFDPPPAAASSDAATASNIQET